MSADAKLAELNLELPPAPKPAGVYSPLIQTGNLIYLSGHGPLKSDGTLISGKVGQELTQNEGKDAARQTGLALLATIKDQLGSLDKVKRIVKVLGMVNCVADFTEHPTVINGCSELFVEIWGEEGRAARSAVGMGSLPGNIAIEIELIAELA